jgi:hypothetical protein
VVRVLPDPPSLDQHTFRFVHAATLKCAACSLKTWDVNKRFGSVEPDVSLRQVGEVRDVWLRGDLELYGQATKRIRWMPWRSEAMKDVTACEKSRGAGNRHRSGNVRMGKPTAQAVSQFESIELGGELRELKYLST